jgi:hypothetical protein
MRERIAKAKRSSLVVLKPTPALAAEGSRAIVWEHGRRNMALQAAGVAPIICPVGDDELSGICIFDTEPDEARAILSEDPGVVAGIFTFEVHACRAFPGHALPS